MRETLARGDVLANPEEQEAMFERYEVELALARGVGHTAFEDLSRSPQRHDIVAGFTRGGETGYDDNGDSDSGSSQDPDDWEGDPVTDPGK